MTIVKPFYGLNGSSPERYAEDFSGQIHAIETAIERMASSDYPHGRDFQHAAPSYQQGRLEYETRLGHLRLVLAELRELQEHAVEEIDRRTLARRTDA